MESFVIKGRVRKVCYVMESFVIKGKKSVLCDGVICHSKVCYVRV